MIRRATLADVPRLVELGRMHFEGSGLPGDYDEAAAAQFATGIVRGGAAFLSCAGSIGGMATPSYVNPNRWMAVEMFWNAFDGQGSALRDAFEAWAREVGADEVRMSAVWTDRGDAVERILRRAGYARAETSYAKELT